MYRSIWVILFLGLLVSTSNAQNYFFVPNKGQLHQTTSDSSSPIAYCELPTATIYLHRWGLRISQISEADIPNIHKSFHYRDYDTQFLVRRHVIDIKFEKALLNSAVEYSSKAEHYLNFFLGNESENWQTRVIPYRVVTLKNVYRNIDFQIYVSNKSVEFDWIIQPRGNINDIQMKVVGAQQLKQISGKIRIEHSVGEFSISPPRAFQKKGLRKKLNRVNCSYVLKSNGIIQLKSKFYDSSQTLVIDPILVFSTYSGSTADNFGFTATYDTMGCLYAGGIVDAETLKYPVTTGAFQTTYGGSFNGAAPVGLPCDISISKYSPDGTKLLYATYLGGSSDEYPHSLSIDPWNNLLVFGTTLSNDFPIHPDSFVSNAYSGTYDIIVSKLSAAGDKLLGGTYLGGTGQDGFQINSGGNRSGLIYNYADNYRGDITTDFEGNIYVATCTHSTNFPLSANAFQKTNAGRMDALVFSLSPGLSKMRWSTLVGGANDDAAFSCRFDDSAHLFIGGGTRSTNFPLKGNSSQATFGGNTDGFILKLNKDDGNYLNGTYWGSSSYDQIYFIDIDQAGGVYFTGQTEGYIKRSAGVYGKDSTHQFIGKMSNDLSTVQWITTFGNRQTGKPELCPSAFMVDDCYNIYFSGWGSIIGLGNNGTTEGLEITPDAHQKTTDNNDFYLIALKKNAQKLVYASYFGGYESEDHVDGGTSRFDKRGIIYQSVCSSCPNNPPGLNDFPTTPKAVFKNNVSVRCSNASFKLDFRLGYSVDALFGINSKVLCLGTLATFTPHSNLKASYLWDFGDGDTSSQYTVSHLFQKTGKYTVTLKVVDSNSCNQKAQSSQVIEIIERPEPKFNTMVEPCIEGVLFQAEGRLYDSIFWNFGDNSPLSINTNPIRHIYTNSGDYTVNVIFKNAKSGCLDTLSKLVSTNADSTTEATVANVFTPNSDGLNDGFRIYGISPNCDKAELRIFNRWGELVFMTTNLSLPWNGKVENDGADVPSGTYYYLLKILETKNPKLPKELHGSINLIRTP